MTTRWPRVSAAIDEIRTLWAGERVALNPKVPPLQPMFQPPHLIPMYIAGYQGRFLDLCGEKADGYLARPAESIPAYGSCNSVLCGVLKPWRSPDAIEFRGYVLRSGGGHASRCVNRAKREPFVIYMMSVLSNVSLKRAGFPPELRDEIAAAWRAEEYHRAGGLIPDELLDAFLACGTREEVAQKAWSISRRVSTCHLSSPSCRKRRRCRRSWSRACCIDGRPVGHVPNRGSIYAGVSVPGSSCAPPGPGEAWRHVEAWYEVTRPFSWTASIVPVLAGAGVAWANGHFTAWYLSPGVDRGVGLQDRHQCHQRDLRCAAGHRYHHVATRVTRPAQGRIDRARGIRRGFRCISRSWPWSVSSW